MGLLISTSILNAQTDFRTAYIISSTGDTIYGEIDYRGDELMSSICRFKSAENTIVDYSPDDIAAYRFIDSKYYVSRELNHKKVFLEYLIKGKVNIYYMRDESGDHYYIDKEDVKLMEIPYEAGIRYIGGKQYYYESTEHVTLLNDYMQDAPGFQSRIQSFNKPEHKNLIKLAEDYHNAVCEEEECVIYEKSLPLIIVLPEILGGVINYSKIEDLDPKFYLHTGIIAHFWMPRLNEKLYFRTGLLFSQLEFEGEKSNYYKIPFQIEYMYPNGIIRPRIAYGVNFYRPRFRSVSINLGGNIELSESIIVSVTSDIEFNSTKLIIPKDLLSYSLQLGLFINIK